MGNTIVRDLVIIERKGSHTETNKPKLKIIKPVLEPVLEPMIEPVLEPVVEPVVEPVLEPMIEPLLEGLPKSIVDPIQDYNTNEHSVEPLESIVVERKHNIIRYIGLGTGNFIGVWIILSGIVIVAAIIIPFIIFLVLMIILSVK